MTDLSQALIVLRAALVTNGIKPEDVVFELSHDAYPKFLSCFIQFADFTVGLEFRALGFRFKVRSLEKQEGC